MAPRDTTFITIVLASFLSCPSQVLDHPAYLPGFWRCKCLFTYYGGPAFLGIANVSILAFWDISA
ncbi:hypothetical protein COCVIDRAFT_103858 [Bipolaris victoriae FI3]|uniref:Uncharacterized protein n=1 Tax=Bipolaris victoriae (strain FI3) TaxID=930091 RepID=W7ELT9_BIPV3|nr:hypothetical protein COCVIDRAFT_103858 [Bipolaris victoriae FI3]